MILLLDIPWLLLRFIFYYLEALYRMFVPPAPKDISRKVAFISGAGMGIGRQLAFQFAEKGAHIAAMDINMSSVQETVAEVVQRGGTARAYKCDVTDTASVKQAAAAIRRDMGEVDILVNNAGILFGKEILDLSDNEIRKTLEVNTLAHFWTVREFLPHMIRENAGHIVTIASMAGKGGNPFLTDYCASKFGAYGFTESLAAELRMNGKTGIHTTTVCPMFVNTAMSVDNLAGRLGIQDRFGRLLQPEEVAQTVVDGMQRNAERLYIPRSQWTADLLPLMPVKARFAVIDFLQVGFVDVKKNK